MGSGKHPVHTGSSVTGSRNTASSLQVTGLAWLAKSCQLGMAKNAFDDQCEGRTEEMERKAPQLLKEELKVDRNLKIEWEMAETKWK